MSPDTVVRVPADDTDAREAAAYLVGQIARTRGLELSLRQESDVHAVSAEASPAISLRRDAALGAEAYRLEVAPTGTQIFASSGAGFFYGVGTLWQLIPVGTGSANVPAQTIRDAPHYAWRGLMLDSARHFQSPAFIKSMIDWMAWHKLNVLHWHLTDDQGWRIEIRKYPRLTSVGGCRTPASASPRKPPQYCGFYTQAQIRDIVAHAASRHVQLVPEIEMPGHAQAAIAAYPELGSLMGPPPPVSNRWGIHAYLFNLEPQTFAFLEDVLSEVMELFPSPYLHVGGDEAVKDQWQASPAVQARARALGIQDAEALQTWFTQEIGRFVQSRGRRLVGWDEILQPGLSRDAVVMSWRGVTGAHAAAVAGNDTVLSPWPTLYFDNRQSTRPSEPPGRMRVVSLEDVYRFEPRDPTLTEAQQKHVLGMQANIWTEHIRTAERVELMSLPRAAAVAEVAWSAPERRNWSDFVSRLAMTVPRYRALGMHYNDAVFAVDRAAAQKSQARRNSRELQLCSDGVSLLLEPNAFGAGDRPLFALDIMNPCWIYQDADLTRGARLTAAVGQLPFNFEIGADVQKIRVGDSHTPEGELEVRIDGCDGAPLLSQALPRMPADRLVNVLKAIELPARPGRHDVCLRFARPRLDPMWALDWVEISP